MGVIREVGAGLDLNSLPTLWHALVMHSEDFARHLPSGGAFIVLQTWRFGFLGAP